MPGHAAGIDGHDAGIGKNGLAGTDRSRSPESAVTLAGIRNECMTAIESGKNLSDALVDWIPDQEFQLIRAGERSGDMAGVLKDVVRIIDAKRQLFKAVLGGTLYPMVLMGIISILLWQIATNMVPQFARILSPDQWTGGCAGVAQHCQFCD